jgi:hypothetical protein
MSDERKVPDTVYMKRELDTTPLLSSPPPHRELHMFEDRIEPALSAEEWALSAKMDHDTAGDVGVRVDEVERGVLELTVDVPGEFSIGVPARLLPATIALANAALKDDDKRKITRAMVADLREAAASHAAYDSLPQFAALAARVSRFADALESYLPPALLPPETP